MSADAHFQIVNASLVLSVPPVFAANPRAGVEEMLDSMIMRYIPSLQGVVLSHENVTFLDKAASIQCDCPFLICTVTFDATVWSPRVGLNLCEPLAVILSLSTPLTQREAGKVSLCSPDHISLLVHRTFNVSIPRSHIPTDTWEFEYGPAENDPEFGRTAAQEQAARKEENDRSDVQQSSGRWVHKTTGQILGSKDGVLEFTVIGLTVANEMLSLLGSLQPDPFSPRYSISLNPRTTASEGEESHETSEDEDEVDSLASEWDSENDKSASDTFQSLGKRKDLQDQAQGAKEKRRRM